MKRQWILTTLFFAVLSFILTPLLWHKPDHSGMIAPYLIPFFIVLAVIESVAFGLGMAFLMYGRKVISSLSKTSKLQGFLTYISIAWLLLSWWPHDNFHQVVRDDIQKLLYIEYGFHLTLILAGIVVAYTFFHPLVSKKR